MTITFGWWLAPLFVTVFAYCAAFLISGRQYDPLTGALTILVSFASATIAALIAWLIWAVTE